MPLLILKTVSVWKLKHMVPLSVEDVSHAEHWPLPKGSEFCHYVHIHQRVVGRVWPGPAMKSSAWFRSQVSGWLLFGAVALFLPWGRSLQSAWAVSNGPANEVVHRKPGQLEEEQISSWGAPLYSLPQPELCSYGARAEACGALMARGAVTWRGCATASSRLIDGGWRAGWEVGGALCSPGWLSKCGRKLLNAPWYPWPLASVRCEEGSLCPLRDLLLPGTCL